MSSTIFALDQDQLRVATLPSELRAKGRDDVRLLVTAAGGASHVHHFRELPGLLQPGDLLIFNRSQTLPAALAASIGARRLTLHMAGRLGPGRQLLELREPGGRVPFEGEVQLGKRVRAEGDVSFVIERRHHPRLRLYEAAVHGNLARCLAAFGQPIRYGYVKQDLPLGFYQTVIGSVFGSSEMPSAARPFTWETMFRLQGSGIRIGYVTLHTSVSSHDDFEADEVALVDEPYVLSGRTAAQIESTHRRGHRVIAVGTTVVRALASATAADGSLVASRGAARAIVTPGRWPPAVDGLISGLHTPASSHLLMLAALIGAQALHEAYQKAIAEGLLWHEFGDVHLIMR